MKVWLPSDTLTRIARVTSVRSAVIRLSTLALITPLASNCLGQFTAVDASPHEDHSILVREGEQLDVVEPHQSGSSPKPYNVPPKIAAHASDTQAVASEAVGGGFISSENISPPSISSPNQPEPLELQNGQAKRLSSNRRRDGATGNLRPADFSAPRPPAFTARAAPVLAPREAPAPRSNEDVAPLPTKRRVRASQQARSKSDVIVDRSVAPVSYVAPVQSFQNQSRRSMQPRQPRQNTAQADRYNSQDNQAAQGTPQRQESRSTKKTSSSAKVLISRFGFKTAQGSHDNSQNLIPLRLADVLNQGQVRANRSQLINQYWETFDNWAQSVSAKQHRDWVNGLRVSKSTDQSTVGVAKSNAENDVASGRIQLGKSQAKLKSILGSTASIVPADLPTVTMVKTNFQAFKERGLVPARFEGIDQTLKDLHDLVLARADTVLLAERTAEQVKGYYKSNQATIEQLLGAGRAWRSAEADFVSSTIEYNKAYADYALALPYGRAPVEQVVAMLVVPAKVTPTVATSTVAASTAATPNSRRNTQQTEILRTPSQPASSGRSVPQRRTSTPQRGQDSRIRAASNGFGGSSVSQSGTQRPVADFSERSNASAAAASFSSSQTPANPTFRPKSVVSSQPDAPQRGNPALRREARPASSSFGGGSAGPAVRATARESSNSATGGFDFGSRSPAQSVSQPTTDPVSLPAGRKPARPSGSAFGSGKPPAHGFSDVPARRPSNSFGDRASHGLKKSSTDPFAVTKTPVKPTASFDGGSATKVTPAGSSTTDGFAR